MPNLDRLANALANKGDGAAIKKLLEPLYRASRTQSMEVAGLAIGTGDTGKVKVVNETVCMVEGQTFKVPAATEITLGVTLPAYSQVAIGLDAYLSGTSVATSSVNGDIDASAASGTTSYINLKYPDLVADRARLGYLIIRNSGYSSGSMVMASGGAALSCGVTSYIDTPGIRDFTLIAGSKFGNND
jgi:hypothetical protein